MRKQGKTYSEILAKIPVAKSTLALWLHGVGLAEKQFQRLTEKKLAGARRGGATKKKQRIERSKRIIDTAQREIGILSERELFLIGTIIYWAEGAKEKSYRPGQGIDFINMDSRMIRLFLSWLIEICKVPNNMIGFETYLHTSHAHRIEDIKKYWSRTTGFPINRFSIVRFKKHIPKETVRKNTGENYYGSLRIKVSRSSTLVRKIAGWTQGIVKSI